MYRRSFSSITTGMLLGYILYCKNIEMNTVKFWAILVGMAMLWNIVYFYCKKDE